MSDPNDPNDEQQPEEQPAAPVLPFGETTIFGTFVFGDPTPTPEEEEN